MSHHLKPRADDRYPISVAVSAWSLVQPTQLIEGTTVDLSGSGALLRLPGLSEAAVRSELRFGLPGRPLVARSRIVRRERPDLVAVEFEQIDPSERRRLLDFIAASK